MNNFKQILAGSLIDGTGNPKYTNALITVKNGHITSLQKHYIKQADDTITDLSAYTVIPRLSDCHTHLAWTSETDQKNKFDPEYEQAEAIIADNINKYNLSGVNTLRDGGDKNSHVLKYRQENKGAIPVKIRCAGTAIYKKGNYGGIIGKGINNIKEAEDIIENLKDMDHVKIVNSGLNSLSEFGEQTKPQFSLEELASIVNISRGKGLHVMAHANGKIPVKIAILSGCSSVEHGFFMGSENLKLMADRQVFWVPTTVTMKAYEKIMPKNSVESINAGKNLGHQLEQLALAREFGVPVVLGTDAGSPGVIHGKSVAEELGLFVKAGYAIEEALKCACRNSARLLGITDSGIIAPGIKAEMIAVPGNPDELISGLLSGKKIIING